MTEHEVRICTDSQSFVGALLSGPQRRQDATSKHWIPGHCELYGNEAADKAAREGAIADGQYDIAIDFNTAKAVIKRKVEQYWKRSIDHPFMEHKRRASYIGQSNLTVAEERILSQLRCGGHCPILQKYLHFIQVAEDDTCQMCRREPETAEHCLLRCPATEVVRHQIFGRNVNLSALWERPEDVIKFLRRTGRLDARQH
ncbi:reverse transcriptase [Aphelenchoides avenae]|nr:reverse transcriptase [Aphelenchus avenae]